MVTLVLATRNAHKVREIGEILGPEFMLLDLNRFAAAPAVVEDASTFAGNATKKAVELARWLAKQPGLSEATYVLADDSGLEVDALGGAPGVHSARFAALDRGVSGNSADRDNNAKLLRLLANTPPEKRTARFRCVIALTAIPQSPAEPTVLPSQSGDSEAATRIFEGACEGHILFEPSGTGGFGYDPLFVPHGFRSSFAELGPDSKNQLSHRSKALAGLKAAFQA